MTCCKSSFAAIGIQGRKAGSLNGRVRNNLETKESSLIVTAIAERAEFYEEVKRMKSIIVGLFALAWGPQIVGAEVSNKHTEPILATYLKETVVSLKLESRSKTDTYHTLNLRLINPASSSVTFTGYSESSPWYKIQKWVEGRWVDHPVGWFCGTGLRPCLIPSGHSSVIPVHVQDDIFPLRVGIEYAEGETEEVGQVVWSAKIERNSSDETDSGEMK